MQERYAPAIATPSLPRLEFAARVPLASFSQFLPHMVNDSPHQDAAPTSGSIDAVIDRLAARAEADVAEGEFQAELLRELVQATAAVGAAIWEWEGGGFCLSAQHQLSDLAKQTAADPAQASILGDVLRGGQVQTRRDVDFAEHGVVLVLSPWRLDEQAAGVLSLHARADLSDAALAGQARFVGIAADLLALQRRNRRFATLNERERYWQSIDRFVQAIHRHDDVEATAFEVVNEGRSIIGCDRLTVILRRRNKWRVTAVSGADTANRRSVVLAQLEHLGRLVGQGRQALWYGDAAAGDLAPELEEPLEDYVDASSSRAAGFLPLDPAPVVDEDSNAHDEAEPIGVLVVECFGAAATEAMRHASKAVCRHSATALRSAVARESMPLHRVSVALQRLGWLVDAQRLPKTVLAALLMVAAVAVLAVAPARLRVEATGTLQPELRRHVFAPTNGVVEQLFVHAAGQEVDEGETLILLRDPELQYESQRLLGELETARKKLAAIEAERLNADRTSRNDQHQTGLRSGEEETLKKQIEGLLRQQVVLDEQADALRLGSPLEGNVLTWDVEQLLASRPVTQGQKLLTVADLNGPWVLELEIPDDRMADVTAPDNPKGQPLAARFILATAPETRYSGVVRQIAPATAVRGSLGPTVSVVIDPDDQQAMRRLRPGASVVAKIDCGNRSMLYVLFHGLIRAVRTHVFF